jgi:hypothetical protein
VLDLREAYLTVVGRVAGTMGEYSNSESLLVVSGISGAAVAAAPVTVLVSKALVAWQWVWVVLGLSSIFDNGLTGCSVP